MITFTLNGIKEQVDVADDMPLLWVLRDVLKRKGTKFGCGVGQCGACTVHLNGTAIRSCITPVKVVEQSEIKTIEGVAAIAQHPIQIAWLDKNVPQCGYCQSGQIMSALSLLDSNTNPSDEQIDNAMAGNICRCGTYPRIKTAIKQAAKAMSTK